MKQILGIIRRIRGKKLMWKQIVKVISIFAFCILINNVANASMVTSVDSILTEYQNASSGWSNALTKHATSLFWLLAFIEFAWAMISLAFKANDMGDWASTIINQIMFVGFFYWLLTNSTSIALSIINSFKKAGAEAAGVKGIAPTDVFQIGIELVKKLLNAISVWSPADSLGILIASIVIMACFALIAAFSILALVESFIIVYAGILFMGFGGSRWTKEYAIRTLQYAVSVGAKLYVLILLLGIGSKIMGKWVAQLDTTSNVDIVLVIGFSIVMLALVKILPDLVQGLVNGTSTGNGGALTAAAAAVGGAVGGAVGSAVGGSMAAKSAGSLASEQLKSAQANGTGPSSGLGTAGFLAKSMAQNLGSAMKEDIGGKLKGTNLGHGSMGGRMAHSMNTQASSVANERAEAQMDAQMDSKSSSGSGESNQSSSGSGESSQSSGKNKKPDSDNTIS